MFRSSSQQGIQGFVRFVIAVPWLTVLLAVATAGVALWYTISALEFETSRDVLASSHARYIQLKNEIKEDFDDTDYLVVVIEPPNLARGKQFVQALVPRLRADTRYFRDLSRERESSEQFVWRNRRYGETETQLSRSAITPSVRVKMK